LAACGRIREGLRPWRAKFTVSAVAACGRIREGLRPWRAKFMVSVVAACGRSARTADTSPKTHLVKRL
jgi:predicted small lipoprotein YifL